MPAPLTPGVNWLTAILIFLCTPAIAVYVLGYLLESFSVCVVPRTVVVYGCLFAYPALATARFWLNELRMHREERASGARRVPRLPGRVPGNLDVVMVEVARTVSGYITSSHWRQNATPFNLWIMGGNIICTSEPEHIKTMLTLQFENFVKGQRFQGAMDSILGTGVFNSDGEMWKFHRAMTRPFFSRDRTTHFHIFDRHATDAIASMRRRLRSGYAVDFQDLSGRFTIDSATDFLFGSCMDTLSADLPFPHTAPRAAITAHPTDACAAAFALLQRIARDRCMVRFWPLFEVFADKTAAPMRVVNAFIDPILERAVAKKLEDDALADMVGEKPAAAGLKDDDTLLDYLLRQTMDKKILRDEVLNMLGAGRDTTASLLTYAIYVLAMYPHVFEKVRSEILARVGPARAPTFDDIKEMKYLKAMLNETLRLYPSIPLNHRTAVNSTTWPAPRTDDGGDMRPFHIPAGSTVIYSVWEMHRRKDLWGDDADEFDPERFLDHRLRKYLLANPFIFLPFNAGPRICLGQQFTYNEVSFFLVRLLQSFSEISLEPAAAPPGSAPPAAWAHAPGRQSYERCFVKSSLSLHIKGGLWVKMEEAEPI